MAKFTLALSALIVASAHAFAPNMNSMRQSSITTNSKTTTTLHETPLSPLTVWGEQIEDIKTTQKNYQAAKAPGFAPTISAKDLNIAGDKDAQLEYMKANAMEIKTEMAENGAVIFRDFDLMKEQEGFVQFYEAIGMKTCLDPLHSVSARPTVDGKKGSPVYEAVNKESRKNFFIGKFFLFTFFSYDV